MPKPYGTSPLTHKAFTRKAVNLEQWKAVNGWEQYEVSNCGNVRNAKTGRILKPGTNKHGYLKVVFSKNGKTKDQAVHRLVAEAFIANPSNKQQVNHINGNKKDNRIENLEWATQGENNLHANRVLGRNPGGVQRKRVLCVETGKVYPSTVAAANSVKGQPYGITRACNGTIKTHKKLHWRFI